MRSILVYTYITWCILTYIHSHVAIPPNVDNTEPDHFVQADFDAVLEECVRLQINIDTGIDGAESAMEEYKANRRVHVARQLAVSNSSHLSWDCTDLSSHNRSTYGNVTPGLLIYTNTSSQNLKASSKSNFHGMSFLVYAELFSSSLTVLYSIVRLLRQEGFAAVDIRYARAHMDRERRSRDTDFNEEIVRYRTLTRKSEFTSAIIDRFANRHLSSLLDWQKIKGEYCTIVEGYAKQRRKREREELVRKLIDEHRATVRPITARTWPTNEALFTITPFSGIVDLAPIYEIPDALEKALSEGKAIISSFIANWVSGIKDCAMNELFKPALKNKVPSNIDPLQLAINVFRCSCQHGRCLTGWENVALHMHRHIKGDLSSIQWSLDGFDAVCELLKEVGLDRFTTSAKDMDERDDRFVCLSCPDVRRREARHWREAVSVV